MPSRRATSGDEGRVKRSLVDPGLQRTAVRDDDDLVGQERRLLGVMGDQHGGQAGVVLQSAELPSQLPSNGSVERRERLVEEEELRRPAQGLCQCHPLALATGDLVRVAVLQSVEVKVVEPVRGPARRGALGEEELLPHGEMRVEREPLGDVAHPTGLDGDALHRSPAVPDRTGRRAVEPGQTPEESRLARPRGTENRQVASAGPV